MKWCKVIYLAVMMLYIALTNAAANSVPDHSPEPHDASAFRIIDRINRELLMAIFFEGVIARTAALVNGSAGQISVCIADYQGMVSGEIGSNSKAASGPPGKVLLLYQPAFRYLSINQGQMSYDNSTGFDADGKRYPIKLFASMPVKTMCLGDFVMVASTAPIVDGSSFLGDWDPFRLIIAVNGRRYNMPIGRAFMGPFDADREESLRPKKSELYDFKPFLGQTLGFGPEFVSMASSEAAKVLLSSIALLAESDELQSPKTLSLSEQSARPSVAVKFLTIIDLRIIEDKYGHLTWSEVESSNMTLHFENATLDMGVEDSEAAPKSCGPSASNCTVEYPFAILKGKRIQLRLGGMAEHGKPVVAEVEIRDCVEPVA